jgi:uncharacterized repeat protein (TIGR03803 family)
LAAGAQTYTYSTIVDFPPSTQLGPVNPATQLAIDDQGNLYGASPYGGNYSGSCAPYGCGTVFKVTPAGALSVLHAFNGLDGNQPRAGVTRDAAGNLYGTTVNGGPLVYYGVLYKIAPDGTETVLYDFPNKPPYGNYPTYGVTLDGTGDFFGYTSFTDGYSNTGPGSIYKFTQSSNTFSIRHTFSWASITGNGPVGSLIKDKAGNYYGANGTSGPSGVGTVFKFTPGKALTVLYGFEGSHDTVTSPRGSLAPDAAGNLYGAGMQGIYEVLASGGEKSLYVFPAGIHPETTITVDAAGNVYGMDLFGGAFGNGAIYRVTPQGVETDIYSNPAGGPLLGDGLVMDKLGNFYGVTYNGGINATGQVFKLTKNAE